MSGVEDVLAGAEAVMGAIELVHGIYQDTDGGLHLKTDTGSYPKELKGFLRPGTLVNREVLKFVASGFVWDTDLGVSIRGSFSDSNEELVCFAETPAIPSNRFMTDVGFFQSPHADTISKSLLDLSIGGYDRPSGSPENPHLVCFVHGHFDPVGFRDERFSFNRYVDTYGRVTSGEHDRSSGIEITDRDGYVEIYLNQ